MKCQLASILLLMMVSLTPACSSRLSPPDYPTSLPAVPLQWDAHQLQSPDTPSAWLDSIGDPQLDKLVTEALQGNFDLRVLVARVKASRAQARLAGADLRPHADLEFDAARRRTSSSGNSSTGNSYSLLGSLGWEVDLWNRLGFGEQAALSELGAAEADRYAAQLSLAANIARSWFRLTEANLQLQLARETENSYAQTLQVIDEQYRNGLNSALDLRLARTTLANARGIRVERQRQLDQVRRELEILLGRYPAGTLASAETLPQLASAVPVGLPSSLLERRPDLRAEALRLTAAGQRTAAANLNRLPIFKLTATAGTASDKLHQLLDWDYLLWSLAGSLTQPLLDGGRRAAERDLAASQADQMLASYAATTLNAFREVEETLAAEGYLQEQESALQTSVSEATEAQTLGEQRYLQGLEGIITLLETQRRAFSAQISLLSISRQRLENRINLHLARGGPFATRQDLLTAKDKQ